MQTASAELTELLEEGLAVWAQPKLIAEWNQNRYAGIASVDNDPDEDTEGYDPDMFPISSIVLPNRPTKGILKPMPGEAVLSEGFLTNPPITRYYLAGADDLYKYWISPGPSIDEVATGEYDFDIACRPRIVYSNLAWVNKIVIGFETTHTEPVDFQIFITTDGSAWTQVADSPTINAAGQVVLYRQDNATWSSTVNRDSVMQIKGVKLEVNTVDRDDTHLSLIEISARLETDLTDYVMSDQNSMTMSEISLVTPLGKSSSNTGQVTLSNIFSDTGGLFDNDNPDSLYFGLIDHNALFTMETVYDLSNGLGSTLEPIRRFTMYTDDWEGQGSEEVQVGLKDASKFLQEVKPLPCLWQNVTLAQIIWELCDMIGFVNYEYDEHDLDTASTVPYFWVDGEQTLWEIFSKLAEATQSAFFFDEFGVLKIQSRNTAYDEDKLTGDADWDLQAVNVGDRKADVVEVNQGDDFEANRAIIKYKATKTTDDNNGFPVMETVWEAEDTLTLRASKLISTLSSGTTTTLSMNATDAAVWPYEGIMQIQGEFIKYKGKGYYYHTTATNRVHKYIYSTDEKTALDNSSHPDGKWKNSFSGLIQIEERAIWNTTALTHSVDATGYTARYSRLKTGSNAAIAGVGWSGGFIHNKAESYLTLKTNTTFTGPHSYIAYRGSYLDEGFYHIGTRFRIKTGLPHGIVGIYFNGQNPSGGNEGGYYAEVLQTSYADQYRSSANEISFLSRSNIGTWARYPGATTYSTGPGSAMLIAPNVWYDMDVIFNVATNGDHYIQIMIDGITRCRAVLSSFRNPPTGRFGLYIRGQTEADFEYLYAIRGWEEVLPDEQQFTDLIRGGDASGAWDREFTYRLRTSYYLHKGHKHYYTQKYQQRYFDEFGPIIHEVREFDVKFEKAPVLHSKLYSTNETQAINPEYFGDAFGAKFIMANAYRTNAVLSGEDTTTFGADNPVDQKLLIYGRLVFQEDEREHIEESVNAILRRGPVEIEIENQWIQSEAMAQEIGSWIVKWWAAGSEQVEVEMFGNPLLQIGDLVSLNYPAKSMDTLTHKYFVIGTEQSFDNGLKTRLTLRRARIDN